MLDVEARGSEYGETGIRSMRVVEELAPEHRVRERRVFGAANRQQETAVFLQCGAHALEDRGVFRAFDVEERVPRDGGAERVLGLESFEWAFDPVTLRKSRGLVPALAKP